MGASGSCRGPIVGVPSRGLARLGPPESATSPEFEPEARTFVRIRSLRVRARANVRATPTSRLRAVGDDSGVSTTRRQCSTVPSRSWHQFLYNSER